MKKHIFKILIVLSLFLVVPTYASATRKCSISFSSKGGTGTMEKQECIKGATIKLNPCTYTKEGHYFLEWEDDFGKKYKDQDYILVDSDKHLYVIWGKNDDTKDPEIIVKNKDEQIISEIVKYQELRGLDINIKNNTWYHLGADVWYYIGDNGLPFRGWLEVKKNVEPINKTIISSASDIRERDLIEDANKNSVIVSPTTEGRITDIVSPKKISTNVRTDNIETNISNNDSKWFYLDEETALMAIGWKVIDKKYYYFAVETIEAEWVFDKVKNEFVPNGNEKEIGQMYSNEYTPDGRFVNSKGAMVNQYR